MGNAAFGPSSSSTSAATSVETADLTYLADRFPFGDAELRHLYRAYQRILQKQEQQQEQGQQEQKDGSDTTQATENQDVATPSSRKRSFLELWAVECIRNVPPQAHQNGKDVDWMKDRRDWMEMVEKEILPQNFGRDWYRAAFWIQGDETDPQLLKLKEENNNNNKTNMKQTGVDEYTRKARLERFFEGLSNSGRKGSKEALQVMFDICLLQQQQQQQQSEVKQQDKKKRRIRARAFVELGYRCALATAFLEAVDPKPPTNTNTTHTLSATSPSSQNSNNPDNEEDEDNDDDNMTDFIPKSSKTDQYDLDAMAHSLHDRARARQMRMGLPQDNNNNNDDDWVEWNDVLDWSDAVAPLFASILPTLSYRLFFPARAYPPSRTAFRFPRLDDQESSFFHSTASPALFSVACWSSQLNGSYYRLYTSDQDGLSFNRLQNALLGYSGPTLLLIRAAPSSSGGSGSPVFGAFSASPWKESKDFYGNSDCFLFSLGCAGSSDNPYQAVFRPTGSARNFQYCNSTARSRGYDQQAHGIGFGGTVQAPRLFLAENLDDCVAASQDLTFANGKLIPLTAAGSGGSGQQSRGHFDLDAIEVWGVGGDAVVQAALSARKQARALKEEGIRRARKVDKAQFLDDLRSGIIDSKAFAHREQIDGRADADVQDRVEQQRERERQHNPFNNDKNKISFSSFE